MKTRRSRKHLSATLALAAIVAATGCTTTAPAPRDDDRNLPSRTPPTAAATSFQIWDLHASGIDPLRSQKVINPDLAQRGYWITTAFMGMPRRDEGDRMGAGGKPIAQADLAERARVFEKRIAETGISGLKGIVMLDAEAFMPYESEQTLAWFNQTARIASRHFDSWFWYFQPHRFERDIVSDRFSTEDEYYDWYAAQDFIRLASAISVTVYHGRERDAANPISAAGRTRGDRHLARAAEFAKRMNKPLIVTVRADLAGKPRETLMTREALEASWREFFLNHDVQGIAIWNDQPSDMVEFDRRWAQQRIEPVIRDLLVERSRSKAD
jgi:hypothetical protein